MDRAALDTALRLGLPHRGWCPRGRRAEDGVIPMHYNLTELDSTDYKVRTRRNVEDSDATLIICMGSLTPGSTLTRRCALDAGRPCRVVDLHAGVPRPLLCDTVRDWLELYNVKALNVAGTRESSRPGIHAAACEFLAQLFAHTVDTASPPPSKKQKARGTITSYFASQACV